MTRMGITGGVVYECSVVRFSQALATAELPLKVANAILDVPARFFNKITAGLRAETDTVKATTDLLKAQAELERAGQETPTSEQKPEGDTEPGKAIGSSLTRPERFQSNREQAVAWAGRLFRASVTIRRGV